MIDNLNGKIKVTEQKSNFKKTLSIFFNGLVQEKYFVRERGFFKVSFFLDLSLEFRMLDAGALQSDFAINYVKYFPFVEMDE